MSAKRRKSYTEKLLDPRWQKKRLLILERDKWKCRNCNVGVETLHIHHKAYWLGRDPWDYDNDNFLTLCGRCHREAEDLRYQLLILLEDNETTRALIVRAKAMSRTLFPVEEDHGSVERESDDDRELPSSADLDSFFAGLRGVLDEPEAEGFKK